MLSGRRRSNMTRFFIKFQLIVWALSLINCLDVNLKCDQLLNGSTEHQWNDTDTKIVTIGNQTCQSLPESDVLRNVVELNVLKAELNSIKRNNFKNLVLLKILRIRKNELEPFESDVFDDLISLESLEMKENEISEVKQHTFNHLVKLKQLILDENKLTAIDKQLFAHNVNLEVLSLRTNYIERLHFTTFRTLVNLREINLYANQIVSLPAKLFERNVQLIKIDVSNNKLQHIEPNIFVPLMKLIDVDFENNPCIVDNFYNMKIEQLNQTIADNCKPSCEISNGWLKDELDEEILAENNYAIQIKELEEKLKQKDIEIGELNRQLKTPKDADNSSKKINDNAYGDFMNY